MNILEAMKNRHSVRQYSEKEIESNIKDELCTLIKQLNNDSGLNMQFVTNEPKAFAGRMAHYGKFSGVKNYIAIVGKKGNNIEEKCGYYGEMLVLKAQQLGLNTCWVGLTFTKVKTAFKINKGEKLYIVIAIGYGQTQGVQHKSKSIEEVTKVSEDMPQWFKKGAEAALLAPTAVNQQKFLFILKDKKVIPKAGFGFYTKLDLGIVKYHFELGAGVTNFEWE